MSLEDTIRRIASASLPENEEVAKFRAIGPILEDLGWDVRGLNGDLEVDFERAVGPGRGAKQAGRSDIALMRVAKGKKECVCLVEAKAPKAKLEDHVDQLVNYAFYEGVDICVLTNSRDWWLYLPREKGPVSDRKFASLKIDDSPERVADDLELFLGKENVLNGMAEAQAKGRLEALRDTNSLNAELPNVWNKMVSGPDQDLVELITRKTYTQIGLSPSLEQIKAFLQGEPLPNLPGESLNKSNSPQGKPRENRVAKPKPQQDGQSSKNKPVKPSYIVLFGKQHSVKSHIDILFKVVETLHGMYKPRLLEILSANWDSRNLYISDIREGSHFKTRDTIPYWINCHASASDAWWRSRKLLEETGNNASDLKVFSEHERELDVEGHRVLLKSAKAGPALDSKHKPSNKPALKPESQPGGQSPRGKSSKPDYIVLFSERHSVKTYKDILFKVVEILHNLHGPRLLEILHENWDNVSWLISHRKENERFEKRDNIPYHLSSHGNSITMLWRSRKLLEETGYKGGDLKVFDEHGQEIDTKGSLVLPKSGNDPSPHR